MKYDVDFGGHWSVGACDKELGFTCGTITISSKELPDSKGLEKEAKEALRKRHPGCLVTGIEPFHGR